MIGLSPVRRFYYYAEQEGRSCRKYCNNDISDVYRIAKEQVVGSLSMIKSRTLTVAVETVPEGTTVARKPL